MKNYNPAEIWQIIQQAKNNLSADSINGTISDGLFSAIGNVNTYDYDKDYVVGKVTPLEIMFDNFFQPYTAFIDQNVSGTNVYSVSSETDQLALNIREGDICIRTDISNTYVASGSTNESMSNWLLILTSASSTSSISNHNELSGLQGTGTDYYHLGSNQYAELSAIANVSGTGFLVRTASNTWAQRSIAVSGNGISISNGNGVSGNPTISLDIGTGSTQIASGDHNHSQLVNPTYGVVLQVDENGAILLPNNKRIITTETSVFIQRKVDDEWELPGIELEF